MTCSLSEADTAFFCLFNSLKFNSGPVLFNFFAHTSSVWHSVFMKVGFGVLEMRVSQAVHEADVSFRIYDRPLVDSFCTVLSRSAAR